MPRLDARSTSPSRSTICGWPTSKGTPCRNPTLPGQGACPIHLPAYTESQTAQRLKDLDPTWAEHIDAESALPPTMTHSRWETEPWSPLLDEVDNAAINDICATLGVNLRVPAALSDAMPDIYDTFHEAMRYHFTDRVSVWMLTGLWRLSPQGNYHHFEEFVHEVVVLDHRISVNPFCALLYPSADLSKDVFEQDSEWQWNNPLCAPPLIATRQFYQSVAWSQGDLAWVYFDSLSPRD